MMLILSRVRRYLGYYCIYISQIIINDNIAGKLCSILKNPQAKVVHSGVCILLPSKYKV